MTTIVQFPDPSDATYDVVVVGAGAAGLVAAAESAGRGRRTLLLEKNRKPGVKILMSGGTRCNITQATDNRGIVAAFGPAGQFLHSPLAALGVDDTIGLFEHEGVATKVESTGKVFPVSNKATDVLAALVRRLRRTDCELALDEALVEIERDDNRIHAADQQAHFARRQAAGDHAADNRIPVRHRRRGLSLGQQLGTYDRHAAAGTRSDYDQRRLGSTLARHHDPGRQRCACSSRARMRRALGPPCWPSGADRSCLPTSDCRVRWCST